MAMTPAQVKYYRARSADRLRALISETFDTANMVTLRYTTPPERMRDRLRADSRALMARAQRYAPGLNYALVFDADPLSVRLILDADYKTACRLSAGWKKGPVIVTQLDRPGVERAADLFHTVALQETTPAGHKWTASRRA